MQQKARSHMVSTRDVWCVVLCTLLQRKGRGRRGQVRNADGHEHQMCATTDSMMWHITAGVAPPERGAGDQWGQMLSTRC